MSFFLGTAQFGQSYGVTNSNGEVVPEKAQQIINIANENGIIGIDTAQFYGKSERIIGQCQNLESFKIITKIMIESDMSADQIYNRFQFSLRNLGKPHIYGVLVHNVQALFKESGNNIWRVFNRLKEEGFVQKIGVSVYDPDQIDFLTKAYSIDIIQFPCNIFDQRFLSSKIQNLFVKHNIEQHIRSVFLQGVLLCSSETLPPYFKNYEEVFSSWWEWQAEHGISSLEGCMLFYKSLQSDISTVVNAIIGVTSASELEQIVEIYNEHNEKNFDCFSFRELAINDMNIIDPRNWS